MQQTRLSYKVPGALDKIAALQAHLLQNPEDMERFAANPAQQLRALGIVAADDLVVSPGYRCLAYALRQPSFLKWLADYQHKPETEDADVRRSQMLNSLQQAVIEAAGIIPHSHLAAQAVAKHYKHYMTMAMTFVIAEIELGVSMVVNTVLHTATDSSTNGVDLKAAPAQDFSVRDAEIIADTLGRFA